MAPGQSKVSDQYNCERKFIQRGDDLTKPSSGRSEARNIAETIDLETLRSLAFQLPDDSKYEELLRQIGDAQVVMIGESTHGSHEFLEERVRITKRLIEKKGFTMVACEADLVDMDRVDRYIRGTSADECAAAALLGFKRYPLWMWRNKVVEEFVEWAKKHNERIIEDEKMNGCGISVHGMDLHGLYKSLDAVLQYLEKRDPEAAERAKQRYSGFEQYAPDPHEYGCATSSGRRPTCKDDVSRQLEEMCQMGPARADEGDEGRRRCHDDEYFCAILNACVVKDAEVYYRTIYESYEDAWSIRDRHMHNMLVALKEHCGQWCGRPCKAVVWAHNCHVSDARATEIAWDWHQINLGQLVKEKYGEMAQIIGFSTYSGTVTAAPEWGEPGRCVRLKPPVEGTQDWIMHKVSPTRFLLDCSRAEPRELCVWKRSIGLMYREDNEERQDYFRAKAFQMYDKSIHIPHTSAIEPLDKESVWWRLSKEDELPQIYPSSI